MSELEELKASLYKQRERLAPHIVAPSGALTIPLGTGIISDLIQIPFPFYPRTFDIVRDYSNADRINLYVMDDSNVISHRLCSAPIPLRTVGLSLEFAKKEDVPSVAGKLQLFKDKFLKLEYINDSGSANTVYYYWTVWRL